MRRKIVAAKLVTEDVEGILRNEKTAMQRKIITNQKEEKPIRKNRSPDTWAPKVPKRLRAFPTGPVIFQNS
jgi:hypothetical protein